MIRDQGTLSEEKETDNIEAISGKIQGIPEVNNNEKDLETQLDDFLIQLGFTKYMKNPKLTSKKQMWLVWFQKRQHKEIEIDLRRVFQDELMKDEMLSNIGH